MLKYACQVLCYRTHKCIQSQVSPVKIGKDNMAAFRWHASESSHAQLRMISVFLVLVGELFRNSLSSHTFSNS